MIKPPLCWMSFLCPIQHFIVGVRFLNIHWLTTILFTTRILLVTFLRMISITILPISAKKWTQNFKILMTIVSGKAQKRINHFRFKKMSNEDIKTYLGFLPNKSNNDILGMDLVLLRESASYISISLANVIDKSHKSGAFEEEHHSDAYLSGWWRHQWQK